MNIHITAAVLLATGLFVPAESNNKCLGEPPAAIAHSDRTYDPAYNDEGTKVHYTCKYGYELPDGVAELISTCNNGVWESLTDGIVCELQCIESGLPMKENAHYDATYLLDFLVPYDCDVNFKMQEHPDGMYASCDKDENGAYEWILWNEDLVCIPVEASGCQDDPPADIMNGHRTAGEQSDKIEGSVASYKCNDEFRMSDGSDEFTFICQGGTWNALKPQVECKPIKECGQPQEYEGMDFHVDGQTAIYFCAPCYSAVGSAEIVDNVEVHCDSTTGKWDDERRNELTCKKIQDCYVAEPDHEDEASIDDFSNALIAAFGALVALMMKSCCAGCCPSKNGDANSNMATGIMPLVSPLQGGTSGVPQVMQPGIPPSRSTVAVIQPIDVMRMA